MVSFAQTDLAAAAGVDPWTLLGNLQKGDPSEIEGLAAAFYRAGSRLSDARAASATARKYVNQGYVVDGGPVLDVDAEATRAEHLKGASEHLPAIAKVLTTVAADLADATKKSTDEVDILNGKIQGIQNRCLTFDQGTGHHLPPDDREAALAGFQNEAVDAVKHSGGIVRGHVTAYEKTLAASLRSMADLGYIPPDAVDEGPGDFDPTRADGAADGRTTIAAINNPDHVAGVRQFDTSSQYVDLLNREMKANGRLTDAEYAYLWQYTNSVGSSLPKIDRWLHDGATQAAVARVDGIDPNSPETAQGAVRARGTVIADGVLNLTKAAEQNTDSGVAPSTYGPGGEQLGRGGTNGLPPSLQRLLSLDLGAQVPNDKLLAQDPEHPGTTLRATWDAKTGQWVIAGQADANGFSDLLANYSSDDVTGGVGFSTAMGEAGVRWKQELNTIEHNTKAYYEAELERWGNDDSGRLLMARDYMDAGGTQEAADYMKQMGWPSDLPDSPYYKFAALTTDDTAASNALTVSAHNSTGAANLLLDPEDRRAVIGLNWQHDHGAALALVSGTSPSSDPHAATNAAAQAVMKDAGTDWRHLTKIAAPEVKDALTTVALKHIDTFAFDNPSGSDPAHTTETITLPGHPPVTINAVQLSNVDAKNYLELISSFGDKSYALVQQAGLERGSEYVAAALHGGAEQNSPTYETAWRYATNLNGHIGGAGEAQLLDQAAAQTTHDAKAFVAAHEQYRNELASYNAVSGPLDVVSKILDVGGTLADIVPGGEAIGTGIGYVSDGLGLVTGALQAPDNPMDDPKYLEAAYKDLQNVASSGQAGLAGFGHQTEGARWMAARALQLAGRADEVPGLYDRSGHVLLPTGYQVPSSASAPGPAGNVSESEKTALEARMFPTYGGTQNPIEGGFSAYSDYTGSGGHDTWPTGYGSSDPSNTGAPGGSWSNDESMTSLTYGPNQRVDWTYGLDDDQKYRQSRGGSGELPGPLLTDDDGKTANDPRTSAYDHPRR